MIKDHQEQMLWRASQNYIKGKIGLREFQNINKTYSKDMRKAFIKLGKTNAVHRSLKLQESADDKEKNLWVISRLYMNGTIAVEQLEDIEINHAMNFKHALIAFAKRRLFYHILELLPFYRKKRSMV